MPRFFFHLEAGETVSDATGTELPDMDAARIEAVRRSGRLLIEQAAAFWSHGEWRVSVTDEHDLLLFTLTCFATEAAAAPRSVRVEPPIG